MGQEVLLNSNKLSSSIPTQLGKLSKMSIYFSLYANKLTGAIVTELGELVAMTEVRFKPRPYIDPPLSPSYVNLTHPWRCYSQSFWLQSNSL